MTYSTAPAQETVGQKIRRLRKQLALSHDRFAERLGTSRSVVIRWEKDIHTPGPTYRRKLAAETGHKPEDFGGNGGDAEGP